MLQGRPYRWQLSCSSEDWLFARYTVSLLNIWDNRLTDTLSYTIPVMVAVLCAKTTADALEEKGIYELVIDLAQLPYLDSKKTFLWGDRQIADVVRALRCLMLNFFKR